ncbi:MAG: SDR family oxidoreductase [Flavobacteriales bacterium]|nr:SDR family oxidoreductase [Flavobacteriales bacterium]
MEKKVVLITGASGGIGSSIAKIYKENGFYVVGVSRSEPNHQYVDKNYAIDLDRLVEDATYFEAWAKTYSKEIGRLDVLINNSAAQILAPIDELTHEAWRKTLNVNLSAPFVLSKFFVPMLELNGGCIINIGSIHAKQTKPRFVAYATSKAGLVGLTQALSIDLKDRVRVNCISPAAVETEMLKEGFKDDEAGYNLLKSYHPINRIGQPEEIAELCLFLSSDKCKFLTGANLEVDGGISKRLHDPS